MEMHVDASMEMQGDACRRKVDWKIVAFLSSVVYYFGDLLKTANMAFVRHKTFISLYFNCLSSLPLILGEFKATLCVLIDIITSSSVRQPRLLRTRNSALSCLRGNINSSIELKTVDKFSELVHTTISLGCRH